MKSTMILGLMFATGLAQAASATELTVVVEGLRSQSGAVMVAVYDKPETFNKTGQEVAAVRLRVLSANGFTLIGLPPGTYAIGLFHDENDNDKLDTNLLGQPVEGYGFSNDARGTFGPPGYDDAKFALPAGGSSVKIKLAY